MSHEGKRESYFREHFFGIKALCIGVCKYVDDSYCDLNGPKNDVKEVEKLLIEIDPNAEVKSIIMKGNMTNTDFNLHLRTFFNNFKEKELQHKDGKKLLFVLFVSGHGFHFKLDENEGSTYLLLPTFPSIKSIKSILTQNIAKAIKDQKRRVVERAVNAYKSTMTEEILQNAFSINSIGGFGSSLKKRNIETLCIWDTCRTIEDFWKYFNDMMDKLTKKENNEGTKNQEEKKPKNCKPVQKKGQTENYPNVQKKNNLPFNGIIFFTTHVSGNAFESSDSKDTNCYSMGIKTIVEEIRENMKTHYRDPEPNEKTVVPIMDILNNAIKDIFSKTNGKQRAEIQQNLKEQLKFAIKKNFEPKIKNVTENQYKAVVRDQIKTHKTSKVKETTKCNSQLFFVIEKEKHSDQYKLSLLVPNLAELKVEYLDWKRSWDTRDYIPKICDFFKIGQSTRKFLQKYTFSIHINSEYRHFKNSCYEGTVFSKKGTVDANDLKTKKEFVDIIHKFIKPNISGRIKDDLNDTLKKFVDISFFDHFKTLEHQNRIILAFSENPNLNIQYKIEKNEKIPKSEEEEKSFGLFQKIEKKRKNGKFRENLSQSGKRAGFVSCFGDINLFGINDQ